MTSICMLGEYSSKALVGCGGGGATPPPMGAKLRHFAKKRKNTIPVDTTKF